MTLSKPLHLLKSQFIYLLYESGIELNMYIYTHIHIHICVCIYIYIWKHCVKWDCAHAVWLTLQKLRKCYLVYFFKNQHTRIPLMLCHSMHRHSVVWLRDPWTIACQAPLSKEIVQARILEWVAMSSSKASSQLRDRTQGSHIPGRFFTIWATTKAPSYASSFQKKTWINRITSLQERNLNIPHV